MTALHVRKANWHEFLVYLLNRPLAYAILEVSRRLGEVVHIPRIGYVISDAEVARAVLTDSEHFDSHSAGSLGVLVTQALGPYALLNMDGADHKDLKRRLLEVFSTRYINKLMDSATADLTHALQKDLSAGRAVDLVTFMKHFASRMACELIGVNVARENEQALYADMFTLATDFTALAGLGKRRLMARDLQRAQRIVEQLSTHIRGSYENDQVRDNSLTQQMRARGFTFDEVKGVVIIVMIGATELITYGMPRVFALLVDSGQIDALRARPALLDQAIDAGFRFVTPSNVILRAVAADCEILGYRFRQGERALIVFHNIMRQEKHFPHAGNFDIERPSDPRFHRLLFGAGPHMCLGTGLAIAEARKVLTTIMELAGDFEILRRRYNRGKTYPGYSSLLIRLHPYQTS
ncbi:MAG: cytochrome P450 [Candidatus Binatia bacterium]